jgi:beta-lactamase class A
VHAFAEQEPPKRITNNKVLFMKTKPPAGKNKMPAEKIKPKKNLFSKATIIALIIGLALGFPAGYLATSKRSLDADQQGITESRMGGYTFINPLLECENFLPSNSKGLARLKKAVHDYVDQTITSKKANHISVYYRNLNNGPWIGINEHRVFTPASLLKVPILIAALKKAEEDTTFLHTRVVYNAPIDTMHIQNMGHDEQLIIGQAYTVEELITYMIVHSDNDAKEMVLELVGNDFTTTVIAEMGINLKGRDLDSDFISIKEYASFFRILYNASYLDRNMSEKALEILSGVTFKEGIPAGLPSGMVVSHKFGEREIFETKAKQLHDCGIVYLPGAPYLLGIMTKGNDYEILLQVIADISKIFYDNLSGKA